MTESIDALRSLHRKRRATLSDEQQAANALGVRGRVSTLEVFKQATNVAAYIAIRGELDVSSLINEGSHEGKNFYLPVLRGESMYFVPWSPGQPLEKKGFGLLEPDVPLSQAIDVHDLDVVLAPLVVFDEACNRIGQGGGFYDRTFAHRLKFPDSKPTLIGVAHESQKEDQLIPQSWDVPLDMIVTDSAIYTNSDG